MDVNEKGSCEEEAPAKGTEEPALPGLWRRPLREGDAKRRGGCSLMHVVVGAFDDAESAQLDVKTLAG
jgi:hypothetical protein